MSSQTERLERVAAEERERLGEHLDQLQRRLEKALDPSALFEKHPLPILATALVGGIVLGAVTRSDTSPQRLSTSGHEARSPRSGGMLNDGVAHLRGAMISMVFAKIAEMVQEYSSSRNEHRARRPSKRSEARAAQESDSQYPEVD
jgi:hypothetical protein